MPHFSARSGDTLWYQDQGCGPVLLFIHGWCMSGEIWKLQCEELHEYFRIITVDLPGHGCSGIPGNGFTVSGSADIVSDLLEELNIEQAVVVGWSLGAFVAVNMVLNHKKHTSALVLVSPTPRFVRTDEFPFGLLATEARGMAAKVQRNIQRALSGFQTLMPAPDEAMAHGYQELLASIPLPSTAVALQALQALVDEDLRDVLAHIDCPVLIIHGDQDRICLPQASEYMSEKICCSRRIVFPKCGHIPFISQSSQFNGSLVVFMGRVSGSAE